MTFGGFIKLHRSLLNWEWHSDAATVSVLVHLLLLANFADSQWRGVALKPGQVAIGRKALAELTGLSERQVRTALTRLKSTGCVTIEATNKYSLISFANWEKFQGLDDEATSKTTSNATNERPASDHYIRRERRKRTQEGVGAPAPSAKRFTPPAVEDVAAYCAERKNGVDAQQFVDFYTAKGWRVGNSPMKDWRAAVRTWERRDASSGQSKRKEIDPYVGYEPF